MFFTYLLLICLIAIAIGNEKKLSNAEQAELVPIRVTDRQIETRKTNLK